MILYMIPKKMLKMDQDGVGMRMGMGIQTAYVPKISKSLECKGPVLLNTGVKL